MRRGSGDPTLPARPPAAASGGRRARRTARRPPRYRVLPGDDAVEVRAWGPGADWALEAAPDLLGAADDPTGFEPRHPVVAEAWRRHAGWRVPRSRRVLEALVPAVLEQKVTGREAWRAFRDAGPPVRRAGTRSRSTTCPAGCGSSRTPRTWATVPSWEWHRAGVDLSRSRTVVTAAASAGRLEPLADLPPAEAADPAAVAARASVSGRLPRSRQRALGDPDAVSVGDYHLSSLVGLGAGRGAGRRRRDARAARALPRAPLPRGPDDRAVGRSVRRGAGRATRAATTARCDPRRRRP